MIPIRIKKGSDPKNALKKSSMVIWEFLLSHSKKFKTIGKIDIYLSYEGPK